MIIGGGRTEIVKESIILHQKNVLHLFLFLYMILLKCCNVMVCVLAEC